MNLGEKKRESGSCRGGERIKVEAERKSEEAGKHEAEKRAKEE